MPDGDWDWVLGVNLMGVVNGLQAFLPLILTHGDGGHIVNTASIGGHQVMPGRGYGVYTTSKFGIVGLSEALADDLAERGIGVSILCPAAVDTANYECGRNRHSDRRRLHGGLNLRRPPLCPTANQNRGRLRVQTDQIDRDRPRLHSEPAARRRGPAAPVPARGRGRRHRTAVHDAPRQNATT